MIELKNVDIHCDDGTDIRQASAVVANGRSLLVYGRDAATRHCLAEALLGLRPVAGGYLTYDGEVLTPAASRYMRRQIGYVPALPPQPQYSLRQMADSLLQLDIHREYRKDSNQLIDIWMAEGISEQHINAPCETIAAAEVTTGMLCMAHWLRKQVVIAEEVADEATAERLREMAAEDSVVIATTANSALADYFDNHINLEELQ